MGDFDSGKEAEEKNPAMWNMDHLSYLPCFLVVCTKETATPACRSGVFFKVLSYRNEWSQRDNYDRMWLKHQVDGCTRLK